MIAILIVIVIIQLIVLVARARRHLAGRGARGWSIQSFSEIFGPLSSLLEYCSQGKTLRPALTEKSKSHRDIVLPSGWSGPLFMSPTALP